MDLARSSGILLHPTSLASPFGLGDFGPAAYQFVDWLADAGQSLWQVLPLGPTGYGDSPYQLFSAFAGNPLLISLELLRDDGWLTPDDLKRAPAFSEDHVDFAAVHALRKELLPLAFDRFEKLASPSQRVDWAQYQDSQKWLDDYALFIALKQHHGVDRVWTEWEPELVSRHGAALALWKEMLAREIQREKFLQWQFARQWHKLRAYARERGIRIMGDVPIYVAHDSADVWACPDLFHLDERGNPITIAGVPPDYFSATGQRWGNPIYDWDRARATGFSWWIERFRSTLTHFDLFRLDHFRGFQAYWEIPASEATAVNGEWREAPGDELFTAARSALGDLPIVAENLGVITPEVEAIRARFGFPGMSILQFAFGTDAQAADFKPHNYPRERFAYTGTHDNDTAIGWWRSQGGDSTRTDAAIQQEKRHALDYLGVTSGEDINWNMIRALLASVAAGAIMPVQDVLGLGSESRFNTPGTSGHNWTWRLPPGALTSELAARLRHLVRLYDRQP